MLSYFPSIKPYAIHHIAVQKPHELYVEESGNPKGVPVLVISDGPGLGSLPDNRRYFDPVIFRIILFDQRGSGQSTPHAELIHNTCPALLDDIETIRQKLNIEKWLIFGLSWGASLGLLYAQAYPNQVAGMILQGISLLENRDVDWLYEDQGANGIFPDDWQEFLKPIPEDLRHNPLLAYYGLLNSKDDLIKMAAAKAWAQWKTHCYSLEPNPQVLDYFSHSALSQACIECHFIMHNYFILPQQMIRHMQSIERIPCILIHGRYDMIHLLENAWRIHRLWPNSELDIIRTAGHAANEPAIMDALMLALQKIKCIF